MQVRNCQVHFPFSIWMSLCQKIWKLAKKRNDLESSTQPLKSHQENCWKCIFSCNELQLDKKKISEFRCDSQVPDHHWSNKNAQRESQFWSVISDWSCLRNLSTCWQSWQIVTITFFIRITIVRIAITSYRIPFFVDNTLSSRICVTHPMILRFSSDY